MAVLAEPVSTASSAPSPTATLAPPLVLVTSALIPTAVFDDKKPEALLFWSAPVPTAVWPPPSLLLKRANVPTSVLLPPLVLSKSAPAPTAVFRIPSPAVGSPLSRRSVPAPTPVLKLLVLLLRSESKPNAELYRPVVRLKRAACPSAVLLEGLGPGSGVSVALCTCWQSPKHTSADRAVANIIFRIFII